MKALISTISTTIQPDRFPDWLIAASVRDFLATVPSALTVEAVVIHDTEEEAPEQSPPSKTSDCKTLSSSTSTTSQIRHSPWPSPA